jgi:hypothetical protein
MSKFSEKQMAQVGAKPLLARVVGTWAGGLLRTAQERWIDGLGLVAIICYLAFIRRPQGFWDTLTPFVWLLCGIASAHLLRAVIEVWRDIRERSIEQEIESPLFLPNQKKLINIVRDPPPPFYRIRLSALLVCTVTVLGLLCFLTKKMGDADITQAQAVEQKQKESKDVVNELTVSPETIPAWVTNGVDVNMFNGAASDIEERLVTCLLYGFVSADGNAAVNSWDPSKVVVAGGLLGGHRGDTIACKFPLMTGPVICADMGVTVLLSVKGHGRFEPEKSFRFAFDRRKQAAWFPVNVDDSSEYCSEQSTSHVQQPTPQ